MLLILTRRTALCALVFLIIGLTCKSQPDSRTAIVHIVLVDISGHDLGIATVTSFQQKTTAAPELRSSFKDNTASGISFGTYNLRVFTKGYFSADRSILVHQSEVWVVVQLDVGEENCPLPYRITGTVQGLPSSETNLWLRAQGLYSSVIADTRADRSGNFELAGLPSGIYILSTRRGNSILDIRSVVVPPPEQKHGTTVQIRVKIKE